MAGDNVGQSAGKLVGWGLLGDEVGHFPGLDVRTPFEHADEVLGGGLGLGFLGLR